MISQHPSRAERVIIGAVRRGSDGKGCVLKDLRLENALGTEKGDPFFTEEEPLGEDLPGEYVPVPRDLILQPIESRGPYSGIIAKIEHENFAPIPIP